MRQSEVASNVLATATLLLFSPAAFAHGYGDLATFVGVGIFLLGITVGHTLVGIFLLAASKFRSKRWLIVSLVMSALSAAAWVMLVNIVAQQPQRSGTFNTDQIVTVAMQGNPFLMGILLMALIVIVVMVVAPIAQYRRARKTTGNG